jgi:hypothetical protein
MAKRMKCIFTIVVLIQFLILPLDIYSQRNATRSEDADDIPAALTSVRGNSCVECHEKLEGALRAAVDDWKKSIHYQLGNNCNICHGGNPDINDKRLSKSKEFYYFGKPLKKQIVALCVRGDCHSSSLYQFKKGPHYMSVLKTGEPNCVSCHGEHHIRTSSRYVLTDKTCSTCHDIEYSRPIVNSIFVIEDEFVDIDKKIEFLKEKNVDMRDVDDKISSVRHLFYQLVHVFATSDVLFTKKMVELELKSIKENLLTQIAIVKSLEFLYFLSVGFSLVIIVAFAIYAIRFYGRVRG